jgi:hypothetical protein
MRVGIDLHGVIDKEPEKMKMIMRSLMVMNIPVHIISGPPESQIFKELEKLGLAQGYHFHWAHSVVDTLKRAGVKMWQDENGNWWADEESWWDSKARICRDSEIDMLIDDSPKYKPAFDLIDSEFIYFKDFLEVEEK